MTPLSTTPTIVGSTVEVQVLPLTKYVTIHSYGPIPQIIGGQPTIAHDHDAQLVYSTQSNAFLLAWEVDGWSSLPYAGALGECEAQHMSDYHPNTCRRQRRKGSCLQSSHS